MRNILHRLLLHLPPELAHEVALTGLQVLGRFFRARAASAPVKVMGLEFASPLGVAAGLDKNARALEALARLGFGFVEVGTVTPLAQPGTRGPRLFRDPATGSLWNRMGFNNEGAVRVAARVARVKPRLPRMFRVGVSLGKNAVTPLEQTGEDVLEAARPFRDLVDYVAVNLSSPNTPGIRGLQSPEGLRPILEKLARETGEWRVAPRRVVKLAPELSLRELARVVEMLEREKLADAVCLTNTLAGVWPKDVQGQRVRGGWSGGVLRTLAHQRVQEVRALTGLAIVGVGGIDSAEEALRRREAGADLLQVYSGFVYGGLCWLEGVLGALGSGR